MQNPVVIKGNKAGMTVYLDPALPFGELLEAVKNIGSEELDDMDLDKLFSAVRKNAQSQVQIARVKLEYERGYNKGLFRATEVVESEARKAGLTEENIDIIKRRILALKVDASEEE